MRIQDLHELPKLRDGLSYLYLERGKLVQTRWGVVFIDKLGKTQIPVAALAVVMLGPGVSITHEAVKRFTDNGCSVLWTGEDGVRLYAQGIGETRKADRLLHQARQVTDPKTHAQVVRRMYAYRFEEELDPDLSMEQIRGREGARVREAYRKASRTYGVPWRGRRYVRGHWGATDSINRALSAANACLNGICHAAIVSVGYSPGLGFIHTGKLLSFVYDIADLYKVDITIPLAFQVVAESTHGIETRVRHACRDRFYQERLLERIVLDMDQLLDFRPRGKKEGQPETDPDKDPAVPGGLWSPEGPPVPGGVLYQPEEEGESGDPEGSDGHEAQVLDNEEERQERDNSTADDSDSGPGDALVEEE